MLYARASLEFSNDKKQVRIVFDNGKKSAWYFCKDTALEALNYAYRQPVNGCRLSITTHARLTKEIKQTVEFPDHGPGVTIEEFVIAISPFGGSMISLFFFNEKNFFMPPFATIIERPIYYKPETSFEKPTFARCWCGGSHWRFFYDDKVSDAFYSQEGGKKVFDALVKDKCFTKKDGRPALQQMLSCKDFPLKDKDVAIMDSEG